MNPPYRKLARNSYERNLLRLAGIDVPNLYAAFVSLGIRLLAPGGQLVAITPRSFTNGPYFKAFRRDLLSRTTFRRIHVYDARDLAFSDSEVLQENVVFLLERDDSPRNVRVTSSPSPTSASTTERMVPYDEVVRPLDSERFIHLSSTEGEADAAVLVSSLPETPSSLGLSISTGRVVDFRSREALRAMPEVGTVPLVYPTHMTEGRVKWPKEGKKPNALSFGNDIERLLVPAGCYVLVKRFSSKEERRRVVASLVEPRDLPGDWWGFENHLNVFHSGGHGLEYPVAVGLAVWLNSTVVDVAFRQFSGHTQVNATDLRNMRFPDRSALVRLGERAGSGVLSQEKIDAVVSTTIFETM